MDLSAQPTIQLTGLLDDVGHSAGSVLAVFEGDLCLAGTLHGDAQASSSGLSGPDGKLGYQQMETR